MSNSLEQSLETTLLESNDADYKLNDNVIDDTEDDQRKIVEYTNPIIEDEYGHIKVIFILKFLERYYFNCS